MSPVDRDSTYHAWVFLSVYIAVRGFDEWLYLLQLCGCNDSLFLYIMGSWTRHIKRVLV